MHHREDGFDVHDAIDRVGDDLGGTYALHDIDILEPIPKIIQPAFLEVAFVCGVLSIVMSHHSWKLISFGFIALALLFGGFSLRAFREQATLRGEINDLRRAKEGLALLEEAFVDSGAVPAAAEAKDVFVLKERHIREKKSFVSVDLGSMALELYRNGERVETLPIAAKGREGSWWETPTGFYTALSREANHFSSIGNVWMPWSVQFYGNFFIHGWPYFADGKDVPSTFSGGCIRLSTEDAKTVYEFIEPGMPILIFGESSPTGSHVALSRRSTGPLKVPAVSAQSVLVAHLETGEALLNKNGADILPIASLTKLMTAVVASEVVNLERSVKISPSMLSASIQSYPLKANASYRAFDLLYPLLMQSSNGSAEAFAAFSGRGFFVENMNRKAESLGMADSRFTGPAGLGDGTVSTSKNLLELARYIYEKRRFLFQITKGETYLAYGPGALKKLPNFNDFANHPDVIGAKIGETIAARETSVTLWSFRTPGGRVPIAVIVLGSENQLEDQKTILEWLKENFEIF